MDFIDAITTFLGIQDVLIEDIKCFRKELRAEIKIRQRREECFCSDCGLQFSAVKEWSCAVRARSSQVAG
jgi:hypothetical protein